MHKSIVLAFKKADIVSNKIEGNEALDVLVERRRVYSLMGLLATNSSFREVGSRRFMARLAGSLRVSFGINYRNLGSNDSYVKNQDAVNHAQAKYPKHPS